MKKGAREKGFGKLDSDTPDGKFATKSKGPKVDGTGMPDAAAHHTGGRQHFQAEHGREDMPAVPCGSRSLEGE
ncbi:MAG TPA: hypothetical protein VF957_23470 [Bradyrhizobium sp.]